jgi:spermidine/putrescine transport system permease protein
MMNPDIVTGISMMLLFVFVGTALRVSGDKLNFWTILIAHVTFCLPYVYLSITPRLRQMDKHLPEAAQDLGCTPLQSFFKVELPFIMPGIISGMIMAFTLSLDDFVISYFTTSESEFTTLPILIYSMTKKEVKPVVYALSTLIIVTIISLLLLSNFAKKDKTKKSKQTKI